MELARATGFLVRQDDRTYLITNWHNLSGVNPETGKNLSEQGGRPDEVVIHGRHRDNIGVVSQQTRPLLKDNIPLWFEHPKSGRKVDVVALPISSPGEEELRVAVPLGSPTRRPAVADEVFVVGYPFELKDQPSFPIWKRGSVATEPEIAINPPRFLIDTLGASGLSGSPVLLRRSGFSEGGFMMHSDGSGSQYQLAGIYSGRISTEAASHGGALPAISAQLGIVWTPAAISSIIYSKVPGSPP